MSLSNYLPSLNLIAADYGAANGGTYAPLLVNWNTPAVDFQFFTNGCNPLLVPGCALGIPPGGTSYTLYVQTDVTAFEPGIIDLIDSVSTGAIGGFYAPVPGPIVGAGLPGLLTALGGLVALVRRRRRKASF
jgi:hypothetical protein